jgi:hypothetical protein
MKVVYAVIRPNGLWGFCWRPKRAIALLRQYPGSRIYRFGLLSEIIDSEHPPTGDELFPVLGNRPDGLK